MPRVDASKLNLEETVVQVSRVSKVVKGGRHFSIRAIVVVGDRNGHVGYGLEEAALRGKTVAEIVGKKQAERLAIAAANQAEQAEQARVIREEEARDSRNSTGSRRGGGSSERDRRGGGERGDRRSGGERRR